MNYKLMLRTLGRTLQLEAIFLVLPFLVTLFYQEDPRPFLYTILLVALLGTGLTRLKSKPDFYSREGYAVVGLIWLVLGLFGALPFWFSGCFTGYVDCLFEAISGFTTTGASILTEIEQVRFRRACELIRRPGAQLDTVHAAVGYGNARSLRALFYRLTGQSPSAWLAARTA